MIINSSILSPKEPLGPDIVLPAEKDPLFLQKYGLAMALFSTAEFAIGELLRLKGGLDNANHALTKALLHNKTLGAKIELLRCIEISAELSEALQTAAADRNMLAHGVTSEQGEKLGLMHKGEFHELTSETLNAIIARGRKLNAVTIKEIQLCFKLTAEKSLPS